MDVVTGSQRPRVLDATSGDPHGIAVAIGNFDGVHLGHRHVLGRLVALARARRLPVWVYTFDPAPTAMLVPERHQPRLCTLQRKLHLLEEYGVDGVVIEAFTPEFARQSAAAFAATTLEDRLHASVVVVGWDFRFGAGRGGDVDALRAALPQVTVEQVLPLLVDDAPVSSSRIRRLILAGDVGAAAELLGRPHRISGPVVRGDARGRTIGFPTANLAVSPEVCLPGRGVYAVRVNVEGQFRPGVLNIGERPTFSGTELRVEAHVLDWSGDVYGMTVDVDVIAALRSEQRFASVEALTEQIHADVARARELLTPPPEPEFSE